MRRPRFRHNGWARGVRGIWRRLGLTLRRLALWCTVTVASVIWASVVGSAAGQAPVDVPKTFGDAMRWYETAARVGHPAAQFYLGFMYQTGLRVEKDPVEAAQWYERAAHQGHV